MALQMAFDIVDKDAPLFTTKVVDSIPTPSPSIVEGARTATRAASTQEPAANASDVSYGPTAMETEEAESENPSETATLKT